MDTYEAPTSRSLILTTIVRQNRRHAPDDYNLPAFSRKKVTAVFEGGSISSDGGLVLLPEVERHLGLDEAPAGCIREWRATERVIHRRCSASACS